MTWTCRTCEKTIVGYKPEHCPECHETFGGTRAGTCTGQAPTVWAATA